MVAVVIPIYKELTESELFSLNSVLSHLGEFPIFFVKPKSFILEHEYHIKVVDFEDYYFNSVKGYNALMLSSGFYAEFREFSHILICQLDAFIFKNELNYWVEQDYSYIGAPWVNQKFENTIIKYAPRLLRLKWKFSKPDFFVGNGGLSLRKVKHHIWVTKTCEFFNYKWESNEDVFWALIAPTYFPFFNISDYKTALKFSFDDDPIKAYQMNQSELPFGCHGWSKYQTNFLKYLGLR